MRRRQESYILHNISPTQKLYQRIPLYSHLRVFGCLCYPLVPHTTIHKLQYRSMPCVFLGYPTNHRGYKCLDLETRKIIINRHVIFEETIFPFANNPKPSLHSYDFLTDNLHPLPFPPVGPNPPTPATTPPSTSSPVQLETSTHSLPLHLFGPSPTTSNSPLTTPNIPPSSPSPPTHHNPPPNSNQGPPVIHSSPLPTFSLGPYASAAHSPSTPASNPIHSPTLQPTHTSPSPPTPPPPPPPTRTIRTRSMDGIVKPKHIFNLHSSPIIPIPKNPKDALSNTEWHNAMTTEFNALIKNKTWVLVPREPNMHVLRSMWLFRHKFRSDGTLERYKARLVCDGSNQQLGVDCGETFSLVVKPTTIRTVLSLALSQSWPIHQLDVINAFLHGNLNETVYMYQPRGFRHQQYPDHVCLLKKSLYGWKQAPRAWYQRFTDFVLSLGFKQSK
ncbi:putative RNA-directed DNA polymerase [Helianthus annuus]|nr:putative RNA-directed DNA polymerase [Helianthus annuus]